LSEFVGSGKKKKKKKKKKSEECKKIWSFGSV
jgi:hypothetical protein